MTIHVSQAILSIIFGIVIIVQPKLLAWLIGIWLIISGLIPLGILKF